MKEIGGYIELDLYSGNEYHNNCVALNSARHCLAYLIESKNIKKIYLPLFLCNSVENICKKYDVIIEFYNIDSSFYPVFKKSLENNEWLYIVNYYGQISNNEILKLKNKYKNIIVDNVQSFFQSPIDGVDTIYTCRKFFGVSDGAYLYTNALLERELDFDISYDRMNFLLGRFEKGANAFYNEYVSNNKLFADEPIKKMSRLTRNFLRAIDYENAEKIRSQNFLHLDNCLKKVNKLKLTVPKGAFMYPLYLKNGSAIRKQLQKQKIYIPTLWPEVLDKCDCSVVEYDYAKNILPLPCDQRYSVDDMNYMIDIIYKYIDAEDYINE